VLTVGVADHAQPQTSRRRAGIGARRMSEILHCRLCGEVIGVYEPLITLTGGCAVESSRALDPALSDGAENYHRACFERRGAAPSAAG